MIPIRWLGQWNAPLLRNSNFKTCVQQAHVLAGQTSKEECVAAILLVLSLEHEHISYFQLPEGRSPARVLRSSLCNSILLITVKALPRSRWPDYITRALH
ncbi:hypothetical protein AcW1_007725 [Taiwanofungus camphoratus]|nr:hypothetical protein AcW1_007725 [Antrodia cinnamomea]